MRGLEAKENFFLIHSVLLLNFIATFQIQIFFFFYLFLYNHRNVYHTIISFSTFPHDFNMTSLQTTHS